MTQISATDQILLLLREQLQRSGRARSSKTDVDQSRAATPRQRIEALAAARDLPERDFRKALVRGLLSEQLGDTLIADPAFEAITDQVLQIIEQSDEAKALLDEATARFRDR